MTSSPYRGARDPAPEIRRVAAPSSTDAEDAFRAAARAWLAEHAPRHAGPWAAGPVDESFEAEREYFARCRAWQRELAEGGWAAITWPPAYGGRGGTPAQALAFASEMERYEVTSGFLTSAIALVGPTLLAHGTEEQRRRYLPPLLRGDEVWCQLFSEPGAGSDLAALRTRAVRDGDEFVVDGQKVWTSAARHADWAILLARTNVDVPKHRGITYFLLDMHSPGVEVRPLRQINGHAHFNEVFLSGVRVPVANVVGTIDGGWAPARTTLANESTLIGASRSTHDDAGAVIALARAHGRHMEPLVRQRLAGVWIRERVLGWLRDRVQADVLAGRRPTIDGSVLKVLWSEGRAARHDVAVEVLGPAGALWGHDAERRGFWQTQLLNRFWGSIGGGTDEIHRTMIGERALGLPPEPRVDKDVPFKELP